MSRASFVKAPKAVEIALTTCVTLQRAEALKFALEGETYLKLYVNVCPWGGCFNVNVGTLSKGATKAKLTELVLETLAKAVERGADKARVSA